MGAYRFVGAGGVEKARPGDRVPDLQDEPVRFEGTIRMGVAQGATSIELWQDYRGFPEVANAKLKQWAELVEANRTP
jgi:hypothetical protein